MKSLFTPFVAEAAAAEFKTEISIQSLPDILRFMMKLALEKHKEMCTENCRVLRLFRKIGRKPDEVRSAAEKRPFGKMEK